MSITSVIVKLTLFLLLGFVLGYWLALVPPKSNSAQSNIQPGSTPSTPLSPEGGDADYIAYGGGMYFFPVDYTQADNSGEYREASLSFGNNLNEFLKLHPDLKIETMCSSLVISAWDLPIKINQVNTLGYWVYFTNIDGTPVMD